MITFAVFYIIMMIIFTAICACIVAHDHNRSVWYKILVSLLSGLFWPGFIILLYRFCTRKK